MGKVSPIVKQGHFKWYKAGWQTEDAQLTGVEDGDALRFRVCLHETNGGAASNQDIDVEYSTDKSAWYTLAAQAGTDKKFRWRDDAGLTEHDSIASAQLSCTTENGNLHENACANNEDIAANAHHEISIILEPYQPDVGDTYYFRIVLEGSALELDAEVSEYAYCFVGKTFGKTDVGDSEDSTAAGYKMGAHFTLSEGAEVHRITAYVKRAAAGSMLAKCAIYSDSSGSPDALEGETDTNTVTETYAWYAFTFGTPVTLSAGEYWLVWMPQYGGKIKYTWFGANKGCEDDEGWNGFSDPYGTVTFTSYEYSIHANYVPSAAEGQQLFTLINLMGY